MYNSLEKIIIVTQVYDVKYKIEICNSEQAIFANDQRIVKIEYDNFVNTLFRIIRFWPLDKNEIEYITKIKIVEKAKEFNYCIGSDLPSNYDSFIDLILGLV